MLTSDHPSRTRYPLTKSGRPSRSRSAKAMRAALCDTEWFYWRIVSLNKGMHTLEEEVARVRKRVSNLERRRPRKLPRDG
jgi:hypothetical protein